MFYGVVWVWFRSEWVGVILLISDLVSVLLFLVWFGVFWCGLVLFVYFFCRNQCFLVWFGCDLFLNDLVWYYCGQVRSDSVCFVVVWCLLVFFDVIFIFFSSNGCFLAWFGCLLVLRDLVWYYWGQVWSELVCFSYCLVSFGVVCCDSYIILC